ncbi:MAG: glycosyltransferase [Cyclobacteriaceae bacterium]|nr:glycosyltransferase [Cyclobacteriaceae bacterium]
MKNNKILLISSYPPRECGIATFSRDLLVSLKKCFGHSLDIEVCALHNEDRPPYRYPKEVSYQVNSRALLSFLHLADKLNERTDLDAICIQHEFGLFGGEYGSHLLAFLLRINIPVCCVFHTVLPQPNENLAKVVKAIDHLTQRLIVLTQKSADMLAEHYGISRKKISVIAHGIHTVLWNQKDRLKEKYSLQNHLVLSTFGLLSENKNIDTVLKALPGAIAEHKNLVYLVLGKTHPEVLKNEGERYRQKLENTVAELGLEPHVIFVNEYLDLNILLAYLSLTDIYLFSSSDANQAVSGTFAYAMSCGCAIVSTPNPHTIEYVDEGKGILLDSACNPEAFEQAIKTLAKKPEAIKEMGKNAMSTMRAASWENVAIAYAEVFQKYLINTSRLQFQLPTLKTRHIEDMTTPTGMLQFAQFSKPDPDSGYTLDDNARALVAMIMHYEKQKSTKSLNLAWTYLKFITYCQTENGNFLNYVDVEGKFTEQNHEVNLEDSNGRALWALGYVVSMQDHLPPAILSLAKASFDRALPHIQLFTSPRAIGFAIKGIYYYQKNKPDRHFEKITENLANELLRIYDLTNDSQWLWFEDYLTYANSVLPEAMMYAWLITRDAQYREIAEVTFDFLLSHYFMKGQIKVISNKGWFSKSNERHFHGEQPIDVAYTIFALDLFYTITKKSKFAGQLKIAFSWFLGNNYLKQIMYNPVNGACYDGLEKENVNINQGAESSVCYFMAHMIAEKYHKTQVKRTAGKSSRPVKKLAQAPPNHTRTMLIPMPPPPKGLDQFAV